MNSDLTSGDLLEKVFHETVECSHRLSVVAGTVAFLVLFAGCGGSDGPARVSITGSVTLDDAPLLTGVIRFVPTGENAGPAASTRIVGGEFEFSDEDGPVVAEHRVEIEATGFQEFAIDDEAAFAAEFAETGKSPLANNPIPANYNSQSTLTANVSNSHNQPFTFNLKSEQQKKVDQ